VGTVTVEREPQEVRVYVFGDSLCFGQYVSPHHVWVTLLSAALERDLAPHGLKVLVQNPSVNGNTTRQALERAPYDFQAHRPDFVFILFGLNDCNHWDTDLGHPRVSIEAFRDNMAELIRRAFQHGAGKVFVATNHPLLRTTVKLANGLGPTYEESNRRYAAVIHEAVQQEGATLIDTRAAFEATVADGRPLAELLLPDGLHLSEAGHELYFQLIYPIVACALLDYAAQAGHTAMRQA